MARLLIVAAAGMGRRLGRDEPKALVDLAGRPLISRTLDALGAVSFARAVVVAPPGHETDFQAAVGGRAGIISGGPTRTESVRRAFEALGAGPEDLVCIHDAARPLITAAEVLAVVEAAGRTGAAIAATPLYDTVKQVDGDRVVATLDRRALFAAATPQVFRADLLRRALESGREATDEAALFEAMGFPVAVAPVSRLAFKITTAEDLEIAGAVVLARSAVRR